MGRERVWRILGCSACNTPKPTVREEPMAWRQLGRSARDIAGTPCFLFSERMALAALATLRGLESGVPLRHWLSLKTQPVARLVDAALSWGLGVEVVSEFELLAALSSDVPGSRILVNGVAKHHWLSKYRIPGLTVHLDSLAEVDALAHTARAFDWCIGLRCAVAQQPEGLAPEWDQFGILMEEMPMAATVLEGAGVPVRGLHFHIHTNVENTCEYVRALEGVQRVCACTDLAPEYIDVGGGLPIAGERPRRGPSAASTLDIEEFRRVVRAVPGAFPSVREVWLENGRFLTGAAGALLVTVLDKKERDGRTYLICDGGRTNHARLATTEVHDIILEPNRGGPETETVVCGPTCGAVDRLGCFTLPKSVLPGDMIIWLNAGAYHVPLETRFSFGFAPVVWFNQRDEPELVRERETASQWWSNWICSRRTADVAPR
jgi:diaminopimelate decarboxylase